jgi:hypothetical protein
MQTLQYYNFIDTLLKEKKIASNKIAKSLKNSAVFKNLERSEIIKTEKALNGGFNYVLNKENELLKHFKTKFPNPIYKPENAASKYRETALSLKQKKCERCGYDKHPEILEVHHKDRNRSNGNPNNLELLCPNCHTEEHYFGNDGRFKRNNVK